MPSWIDTHTHLEHEYPFSTDEYLTSARAAGVKAFITIGTTPDTLEKLRQYADHYSDVYFTVGIHPHDSKDFNRDVEALMDQLRQHPKCVAIGEIGLDYHYDHSHRETQLSVFERQMDLAASWNKPIVIHSREGEEDLVQGLKNYVRKKNADAHPGVIHCFSGTQRFAEACLELGFYISFSGIVTFKKANDLRDIVRHIPLDRILLETDSPYLAPVPYRGKPNQSAYMIETAKTIASIKNVSLEELSLATISNSKSVFGLST